MHYSMLSCGDVLNTFGPKEHVPNEKAVVKLIYSGTQHETLQVMSMVDKAHGKPGNSCPPNSSTIIWYHLHTGKVDKVWTVEYFVSVVFLVVSCTMALGLGKNWS